MIRFYFVAVVDLLGQADALAKMETLPRTDPEQAAWQQAIEDTGLVVRNVRNSFSEYFEASKARGLPDSAVNWPTERREEFARICTFKARQWGFSDSWVIAIPVAGWTDEPVELARTSYEVLDALLGLAALSMRALSDGIPLRAGIDIGLGMEIFSNEIYGPALLNAYRLESQVAEYPRSAVGPGVLAYLKFLEQLPQENSPVNQFTVAMAKRWRGLICEAPDDGWSMLHFLSPMVAVALNTFEKDREIARQWLRDKTREFAKEGDQKLARRYIRLLRYFDKFAPR